MTKRWTIGTVVLLAMAAGGCKGKAAPAPEKKAPVATGSGSAAPVATGSGSGSGSAAPVATGSGGAAPALAGTLPTDLVIREGFATPESVLYDAASDTYLVANINGKPLDRDDNGYIARVTPDGKKVQRFIDGDVATTTLNAPKGMAIVGGKLYVADIDTVRIFDAITGVPAGEVVVPGASFLNDVTADAAGGVVVTDTGVDGSFAPLGTDAVYRIDAAGTLATVIKDPTLAAPNGIVDGGAGLRVVSGTGELYGLAGGKRDAGAKLPTGGLDGIVLISVPGTDPVYLVSSWEGKAVYRGREATWTKVVDGLESPADIGWDSKRHALLIPVMMSNALVVRILPY